MGIWNRLTGRGGPPTRLKEISQRLARPTGQRLDLEVLMADDGEQGQDELFKLCEEDTAVSEVMKRYQATRATLSELFTRLRAVGAGQWAGGHYVAASALAYPHTLEFLLRYFRGVDSLDAGYPWPVDLTSDRPERAVAMRVAYELIVYFESGRTGPVVKSDG